MSEDVPQNALFVCFGGMSNVGILSGLASLEAIRKLPPGKQEFSAWEDYPPRRLLY